MGLLVKKCGKCQEVKAVSEFYKDKRFKDAYRGPCKLCINKYKQENKDIIAERSKKYYQEHKEKIIECNKKYRQEHKEEIAERKKKYYQEHKQKFAECNKKYKAKLLKTKKGNISKRISRGINRSLKTGAKNRRHWETLVDYDVNKLKKHIEKQFVDGMSWDNMGEWHIDHIIPISAFNYEKPEDDDFKRCWDLKNLRPLWAKENLIKYKKLHKPFQPALIF